MAINRANRRTAPEFIGARKDFQGSNLRGEANPSYVNAGRLPEAWANELRTADRNGEVAYVVYSYATPIAWVLTTGEVIMPDVKYSPSTSNHQSVTRKGFNWNVDRIDPAAAEVSA